MADSTFPALVAASATLITAFITQFLAESYKRFKDGSAIAAGIVGELSSYKEAVPLIRISLDTAADNIKIGRKDQLRFRDFEKPVDRFFDEVVGKVGVLGPELAESVIFIYANLNAFRSSLVLIHRIHNEMDAVELLSRITLSLDSMERAVKTADETIPKLRSRSEKWFWRCLLG